VTRIKKKDEMRESNREREREREREKEKRLEVGKQSPENVKERKRES